MSSISNKFLNRLFRRVQGIVWDVSTGSVGLRDADNNIHTISGLTAAEGAEIEPQVTTNPFGELGFSVPALATQVPLEQIGLGDLVLSDKKVQGWVVGKTAKSLKVMDHTGVSRTYTPPKVTVMGGVPDGVLVVQSLFTLAGGAQNAQGFASGLLPLLLLSGDDEKGLSSMLPLLMMQGGGLGGAAPAAGAAANPMAAMFSNPMVMLMMMDKGGNGRGGKSFDFKTLMLMQALGSGGAAGMNPIAMMALLGDQDIFGNFPLDTTSTDAGPVRASTKPSLRPA